MSSTFKRYFGVVAVQLTCDDGTGPYTGMVEVDLTETKPGELQDPAYTCMLAVVQAGETVHQQMESGELERVVLDNAPGAAEKLLQKLRSQKGGQ